jgi:hypothetical protein
MNKSVRKLDSIDGTVTQICANSYSYIPTPLVFICQPALTIRCPVCKNKIILPTAGKNGIDGIVQWLFHAIQIQVSRKQINHSVIFAWGCFLSLLCLHKIGSQSTLPTWVCKIVHVRGSTQIINHPARPRQRLLSLPYTTLLVPVFSFEVSELCRVSSEGLTTVRILGENISRQVTCCYKPSWKHLFHYHWTNNKQKSFMCSDEFNVIQCSTLSQHPQYTVKVHSLHATLNC